MITPRRQANQGSPRDVLACFDVSLRRWIFLRADRIARVVTAKHGLGYFQAGSGKVSFSLFLIVPRCSFPANASAQRMFHLFRRCNSPKAPRQGSYRFSTIARGNSGFSQDLDAL